MKLSRLELRLLRLPLKVPYHLAFGDIDAFDTVVIEVSDEDGRSGFGEATFVPAYGGETPEEAWAFCCRRSDELAGMRSQEAKSHLDRWLHAFPFSVAAFTMAVEMLEGNSMLSPAGSVRVPILGAVGASDPADIPAEIEHLLELGYGTLKVKVGFDLEPDLERVRIIQDAVAGRALIRLDGNQGYSMSEACRFAAEVSPRGVELLEQPCAADDWAAAQAVARVSQVPMMMDESIFGIEDIDRAADLGIASFIKLKLLKAGGLERLAQALEHIRSRGMEPVLGNGIASDLACWMEACVAVSTIRNAGEFNGFLRPVSGIIAEPLPVDGGAIVLSRDYVPELDRDRLAASAVASHRSAPSGAHAPVPSISGRDR